MWFGYEEYLYVWVCYIKILNIKKDFIRYVM